jgi:hypothetical protein
VHNPCLGLLLEYAIVSLALSLPLSPLSPLAIINLIPYFIEFGDEKAKAWLTLVAISTGQDGFINQPLKLLFSSVFIMARLSTMML